MRNVSVLLLLVGVLTCHATAQDRPVFRSGVDLVRLDVRVADKDGRPIEDLRPEDLTIVDGGEERPILLLQHVSESGHTYIESAERTVASEVSTNQGAPRGELYVLLFDQQHLTAGMEPQMRQAAETFLRKHVRQEDRVAVYGVPAPGPSLPFTSNVLTAIDQLQHIRGGLDRTPAGVAGDMTVNEAYQIIRGDQDVIDRFVVVSDGTTPSRTTGLVDLVGIKRDDTSLDMKQRLVRENAQLIVERIDHDTRQFLRQVSDLLRGLRTTDGRKTIVLFSEGFHGDNVAAELRDVAAAAAETHSVIQSFDMNRRFDLTGDTPLGNDIASDIANRLEPIGSLAAETSGALVVDALTHLDQALNQLGAANNDYYVLGFAPSAGALADREAYRHVQVRVARPGATVTARTGYAAGPAATPADRRRVIDAALSAPFTQQGLAVEYTTYISRGETRAAERVILSLDAELPLRRADDSDAADIVFVVRNTRDGHVAASGTDQIALPTDAESGSATGRSVWHVQFSVAPGDYLMRCVVREPGGQIGSADRHFTVSSLSGPDVAASDLMLGSPGVSLPVRTRAYTDAPLSGAVRVYGRSAVQLAHLSGTLTLAPADGETATVSATAIIGETRDNGTEVFRDVMFDVPLAQVPAGEYVAHAVLRAQDEILADRRRQVEVRAGAAPMPMTTAAPQDRPRDVLTSAIAQRLIGRAQASQDAVIRRAAEATGAGRWADAVAALVNTPASNLDATELRGLARLGQERYADAAAQLAAVFTLHPDDAALAFVLGWARVGAGDDTGAVTAFRNAVLIEPGMIAGHLALADAYLRLHQPALAVAAIQAGLDNVPNSIELKKKLETIK
jgi:VWFA-related protein